MHERENRPGRGGFPENSVCADTENLAVPAEPVKLRLAGYDEKNLAFIRWLFWQTAKFNLDDWRESRWWPLIGSNTR